MRWCVVSSGRILCMFHTGVLPWGNAADLALKRPEERPGRAMFDAPGHEWVPPISAGIGEATRCYARKT